ncbi:hypothetical protein [Bacillus kexueae]|uniref:hypothetical protein n=1 Tax=Aeribacillus kexueae TaxID=2078952 RepID=UPI001FAF78A7|nr:hypothetical protein [Bacillus kexueae]
MEETLRLILNELQELKIGQARFQKSQEEMKERQQRLSQDVKTIKEHLFSSLGMYFESVEKHIDEKTKELKIVLEEQQKVIDTLAVRSVKHESEIRDIKRILESR